MATLKLGRFKTNPKSKDSGKFPKEIKGFYFNVFTWGIFRFLASFAVGFGLAFLMSFVLWILVVFTPLTYSPLNFSISSLIGLIFSVLFVLGEENEQLEVPATKYVAHILWFGMSTPIYLRSGKYSWTGKLIGFTSITQATELVVREPFTDGNGFIKTGDVQFTIWDAADLEENDTRRNFVTAIASNGADIIAAITLVLQSIIPSKTFDSDDPALDLGQRSRQEFRELAEKFTDKDLPSLSSDLGHLFNGGSIVTAMIGKNIGGHEAGSMIRDISDKPMYVPVVNNDLDRAIREFAGNLGDKANPKMLKDIVYKDRSGKVELNIVEVKLKNPIKEVLDAIGFKMIRTNFAEIKFSQPVRDAANKAAAEAKELAAQVASAKAIKKSRQELMPTKEEIDSGAFELTTILAAAQDDKSGNIKVIMVPGGNSLAGAAVAGASQIGGNT